MGVSQGPYAQKVCFVCILIGVLAFWGCAGSGSAGPAPTIAGQIATTAGLVRDLDAAVRFAASKNDMVVVLITDHAGDVRAYEMKSVRDEPVAVQVTGVIPTPGEPRQAANLTMTAKVGRFGDSRREQQLLADIRARLATTGADPFGTRPHPG